jgi:hypothetical protein
VPKSHFRLTEYYSLASVRIIYKLYFAHQGSKKKKNTTNNNKVLICTQLHTVDKCVLFSYVIKPIVSLTNFAEANLFIHTIGKMDKR